MSRYTGQITESVISSKCTSIKSELEAYDKTRDPKTLMRAGDTFTCLRTWYIDQPAAFRAHIPELRSLGKTLRQKLPEVAGEVIEQFHVTVSEAQKINRSRRALRATLVELCTAYGHDNVEHTAGNLQLRGKRTRSIRLPSLQSKGVKLLLVCYSRPGSLRNIPCCRMPGFRQRYARKISLVMLHGRFRT